MKNNITDYLHVYEFQNYVKENIMFTNTNVQLSP